MNRLASVMVMHARDRATWFLIPASAQNAGFVIVLSVDLLCGILKQRENAAELTAEASAQE